MYCPYHNEDHPLETNFSAEHVIPYALGGSNQFTIRTCASSNNTFGRDIDARFERAFPVAYQRFIYGIESTSGNPPTLSFKGNAEINGKSTPIEYEISAAQKKLITKPLVQKEQVGNSTRYQIQAAPADVQKMIKSVDEKATKQGKQIVDGSGKPISPAELLARAGVQRLVPTIECTWDYLEWAVAAQREFVKLVLGAAHFMLGEKFSRSGDASLLRSFLVAPDHNLERIPINGTVWPHTVGSPLQHLSRILGDPRQHLVALLHLDRQLQFFISLFGDINGLVVITKDADICSFIPAGDGVIVQIDPVTRAYRKRTFMALLQALSRSADEESDLPESS